MGKYGMYSISKQDKLHYDCEDIDWGGRRTVHRHAQPHRRVALSTGLRGQGLGDPVALHSVVRGLSLIPAGDFHRAAQQPSLRNAARDLRRRRNAGHFVWRVRPAPPKRPESDHPTSLPHRPWRGPACAALSLRGIGMTLSWDARNIAFTVTGCWRSRPAMEPHRYSRVPKRPNLLYIIISKSATHGAANFTLLGI